MTRRFRNLHSRLVRAVIMAVLSLILYSCDSGSSEKSDDAPKKTINTAIDITDPVEQDSLFKNLLMVTGSMVPSENLDDSLAFLLLPIHASCPSCREKTIDSIVEHEQSLPGRHYIIIAGKGGKKTLGSYFRERHAQLPELPGKLSLDTTDESGRLNLFTDNTVFYYTANRKVYHKVSAIPDNVKKYLHDFFSGNIPQ